MKIAVINPNSTISMTDKIANAARQVAHKDTQILASNPTNSPPSIEGHYDGILALPGLIDEVKKAQNIGVDGFIIACFDDPGINACRELTAQPVIGIGEAAMHCASLIAASFSIVTTLNRSVPIIEEMVVRYGKNHLCKKVRAADISVLDLEDSGSVAKQKIIEQIQQAKQQDGCEAIILGCAGMADLTAELSQTCQIPVLDGVVCAVKLVEALASIPLLTSKVNSYAYPRSK